MENELITTEVWERGFTVSFKKIRMHEELIKLSEILERRKGVYAKKPIKNFGDCDLRIHFGKDRDGKDRDEVTITLIKPMSGNRNKILVGNFYSHKEIIQTALEILPPQVKTQYFLWKEGIF